MGCFGAGLGVVLVAVSGILMPWWACLATTLGVALLAGIISSLSKEGEWPGRLLHGVSCAAAVQYGLLFLTYMPTPRWHLLVCASIMLATLATSMTARAPGRLPRWSGLIM